MALKTQFENEPAAPPSRMRSWGVLTDNDETAQVVRFVVGDRSVSFPFHAFKRWEFAPGATDLLTIRIEQEIVTVQGRGLAVVRDALDAGELLVLRAKAGRLLSAPTDETTVTGITFAVAAE
jgi:hypothetical protein